MVVRRASRRTDRRQLADVLLDTVEGGASIGFMHPLSPRRAQSFWKEMLEAMARHERVVLVAEDRAEGTIVGTVQVVLAMPENQPHRGEIAKMMVRRSWRRRGVGDALLAAAEEEARCAGKTLLILDTASADAERLYARHGWQRVGVIPDYALWPAGGLVATTIFYKDVGAIATDAPVSIVRPTDGQTP